MLHSQTNSIVIKINALIYVCVLHSLLFSRCVLLLVQVFAISVSACPSTDSFQNQSLASAGPEILGRVPPSVGWGPAGEMKSEGPPKRK